MNKLLQYMIGAGNVSDKYLPHLVKYQSRGEVKKSPLLDMSTLRPVYDNIPSPEKMLESYKPLDEVKALSKAYQIAQREIDALTIADRKARINASLKARKQPFSAKQLADETQAIGDKLRLFPNDPNSFIDDYLNPAVFIGNLASNLGRLPLNIQEGDYIDAAMAVVEPLAIGAYETIASPLIKKMFNKAAPNVKFQAQRGLRRIVPGYVNKKMAAIDKGNQWTKDWYSNPIIKERYDNWVEKGYNYITPEEAAFQKQLIETQPNLVRSLNLDKSYANRLSGIIARDNYDKLLEQGFFTKGTTNRSSAFDANTTLARYAHGPNDALVDVLHPEFRAGSKNIANTTVHENIHAITKGDHGLTRNARTALTKPFAKAEDNFDKYLRKPTEVHARIGELRRQFRLTPEQHVDLNTMNRIMDLGLKGKTSVDQRWFELVKDKSSLRWLFNNAPAVVAPVAGVAMLDQKKGGGVSDSFSPLVQAPKTKKQDGGIQKSALLDTSRVRPVYDNVPNPMTMRQNAMMSQKAEEIERLKAFQQGRSELRSAGPKRSAISKALAIAANPLTAASYIVKGQSIPENFERGSLNAYDMAGSLVNPFSVIDAASKTPESIRQGDYLGAAMNIADMAPGVVTLPKSVRAALNQIDKFSPVGKKLDNIQREGRLSGLSDFEIAQRQLEQVGITSNQRQAYIPGVSDFARKYVTPYSYTGLGESKLKQTFKNILKGQTDHEISPAREDAWRMYLGYPQRHDTFRMATTAPINHKAYSKKQLKNMDIYSLNNEAMIGDDIMDQVTSYRTGKAINNLKASSFVEVDPVDVMGNYNARFTNDGLQYNDIWDLEPKIALKHFLPQKVKDLVDKNPLFYKKSYHPDSQKPVYSPRYLRVNVNKFFGKPFMSHGNLETLTGKKFKEDLLNTLKERVSYYLRDVDVNNISMHGSKIDQLQDRIAELNNIKKFKKGGVFVSSRGQWDYPGYDTLVPTPTGQITMQGVPYPVYGEDETGYGQMMYPGGEYQFPGRMVYEKPIMQTRGPAPLYVSDKNNPRLKAYNDSLRLYTQSRDDWNKQHKAMLAYLEKNPQDRIYFPNINNASYEKNMADAWAWKQDRKYFYENYPASLKGSTHDLFKKNLRNPIQPVSIDRKEGSAVSHAYYKKPVQPVVYRRPQPPSSVSLNTTVKMDPIAAPVLPQLSPRTFTPNYANKTRAVDFWNPSMKGGVQGGWHRRLFNSMEEADNFMKFIRENDLSQGYDVTNSGVNTDADRIEYGYGGGYPLMQYGGQKKSYNPRLAAKDVQFQNWYKKNTLEGQRGIPYSDQLDYDYFSFYKNGDYRDSSFNIENHFPDTYKRPSHYTFSNESIYSTPENPGGYWEGENYFHNGKFKYQDGGPAPLYVSDSKDTRLKNYEDSLYNYNLGRRMMAVLDADKNLLKVRPGSDYDKALQAKVKGAGNKFIDNSEIDAGGYKNFEKIGSIMKEYQRRGNKAILPIRYQGYFPDPDNGVVDMVTLRSVWDALGVTDPRPPGAANLPEWKKPERQVVYKPAAPVPPAPRKTGKKPSGANTLFVNDPNDPRLKAYQDSLRVSSKHSDLDSPSFVPGNSDWVNFVRRANNIPADQKIDPIGIHADSDGIPVYKYPRRPVVYKRDPPQLATVEQRRAATSMGQPILPQLSPSAFTQNNMSKSRAVDFWNPSMSGGVQGGWHRRLFDSMEEADNFMKFIRENNLSQGYEVTNSGVNNDADRVSYSYGGSFIPKAQVGLVASESTSLSASLDPRTRAAIEADRKRIAFEKAKSRQASLSSGKPANIEETKRRNEAYARSQGLGYDEASGRVYDPVSPQTSKTLEAAYENMVEPMMILEGAGAVGAVAKQGIKQVAKEVGKSIPNKIKPYNLLPEGSFAGYSKLRTPEKSYRVAGMDAFEDFKNSQLLRAKPVSMLIKPNLSQGDLGTRYAPFPSFQKGYADLRYLPEEGGVVFETSVPTFKRGEFNPVTNNRIRGRHYAHRAIDLNTGKVLTEIPSEYVNVYESSPHWLKGHKQIKEEGGENEEDPKTLMKKKLVGKVSTPIAKVNLRPVFKNFKTTVENLYDPSCPDGVGCSRQATKFAQKITGLPWASYAPADATFRDAVAERSGLKNLFDQTGDLRRNADSHQPNWKYPTKADFDKWKAGDIVSLDAGVDVFNYSPPPGYTWDDASQVSHNGVVVGFTEEGRPIIKHGYATGRFKGKSYTEVLGPDNRVKDLGHGRYAIKSVWRPKEIDDAGNINRVAYVAEPGEQRAARKQSTSANYSYFLNPTEEEKMVREQPVAAQTSGAANRLQTKQSLINMFNNEQLDKELQYKLGMTAEEVDRMKPVIFGVVGQESRFNDIDNPAASLKEVIGSVLGRGSRGAAQIKLSSLTKDERKVLGINRSKDLEKEEVAYKAAMLLLNNARKRMNQEVAEGTHPELVDKDEYFRSGYYYNAPARAINSAKSWGDRPAPVQILNPLTWANRFTSRRRPRPFGSENPDYDTQNELRMDKGSYPWKLMQQAKDLGVRVDFDKGQDLEEIVIRGARPGSTFERFSKGGQHGGLDRWFAEKWVDVKTGKDCGRQEGEKRGYPACRPSKRVSSETPKTSSEMSSAEKAKFKRTKTSSERIPYNHKRK